MQRIADSIRSEVAGWPGVEVVPHRFGGTEFRAQGHEIGHLHGGRLADLPFPRRVREALVASARAAPHHVLPDTGWVSFWIRGADDVPAVVELFRMNYARITGGARSGMSVPGESAAAEPETEAAPSGTTDRRSGSTR